MYLPINFHFHITLFNASLAYFFLCIAFFYIEIKNAPLYESKEMPGQH